MKFFGVLAFLVVVAVAAVAAVAADSESVNVEQIISTCTCDFSYNPICGSDNYTYGNKCIFDCVQEKLAAQDVALSAAHKGACSA